MNIDFEAQQAAQAQLDAGERLLWHGRPDPKRQMLGGLAIMLFGIPWTAFALFWTGAASGLRDAPHMVQRPAADSSAVRGSLHCGHQTIDIGEYLEGVTWRR